MKKRLLSAQFLGVVTLGLITSVFGALLPVIKSNLGLNYEQAGLILSSQFFGSIFSIIIGAYSADRFGKKNFVIAGGSFIVFGMIGVTLSTGFNILFLAAIISGIGFGAYNVGINALCIDNSDRNKGTAVNMLHGFYGIGAVLGPVLATIILKIHGSWRPVFGIIAVLPIIVWILLGPAKQPQLSKTTKKTSRPYNNWFIWLTGIFAFIYIGVESTMSGWMPVFWEKMNSAKLVPASLIPTIFWGTLTIGRLICGPVADKMGLAKFIIILSSITVALALSLWLFAASAVVTLLIIFLTGMTIAGIYPTLLAATTSRFLDRTGEISAFIALFLSVGGFVIPVGTGGMADNLGIMIIPAIFCGLSVLMIVLSIIWRLTTPALKEVAGFEPEVLTGR